MLTRSSRSWSATTIFIWPGASSETWATGTNRDMGHLSFCGCPLPSTPPMEHFRRYGHLCTSAPQEPRLHTRRNDTRAWAHQQWGYSMLEHPTALRPQGPAQDLWRLL